MSPDSGAYIVQPVSAAPPSRKPLIVNRPPVGTSQKPRALMRGKAMSAAPIWSGTT